MKPGISLSILALILGIPSPGQATPSERLLGEFNCSACHEATEAQAAWLLPKAAPRLTEIGARVNPAWIRDYLTSPRQAHPGTTMPDLLHGLTASERAEAAETLTHYLVSLSPSEFQRTQPDRGAAARGEALFHRVGCVACHAPENSATTPTNSVPWPAEGLAAKWSFDGLRKFLRDPLATRPSGRMPSLQLTDTEAADIAHYLLRATRVTSPLEVEFYRGRLRSLDDIDSAELIRTVPAENYTIEAAGGARGDALRFNGWLRIDQAGDYSFYLTASGSSRLAVGGNWLLGEESWRREEVKEKQTLRLEKGWHPLTVDFVRRGRREPVLQVEWEGAGLTRGPIPSAHLRNTTEATPQPASFRVDPAKAIQGRKHYENLRCASCHEDKTSDRRPPALAALRASAGCLADAPPLSAPDFGFNPPQRDALREMLTRLNHPNLPHPSPAQRLAQTLETFRCTACHTRDGHGGVPADRDAFFTTNVEDLGDEGRLPPRLDGMGDKLSPAWLKQVLVEGASVRPYGNTRMPRFGETNVGQLTDLFVALDRREESLPATPTSDTPEVQREAGRRMIGTDGLSCIACHRFNRQPAHALQVIDLITAPERLNEDWFRRFLIDPNRFHPGTRMPSFWPEGVSLLPNLLDGDTARQHAALWTYLSDGMRAKFPAGLGRQNMELIVGGEAVVYRGKLWEAGFRAVAVGYPGQVNAAFDAEEMRLALLWRGRFLNAAAHWAIQGMGQIRPLGTEVITFPHGTPFAILSDRAASWPEVPSKAAGMRYRGLQQDRLQQPTFLYALGNLEIEDFLQPIEAAGRPGLHRRITFRGEPAANLYLRLAAGKIEGLNQNENTWRLDDRLTLRLAPTTTAFTRAAGDGQELLVSVSFSDPNRQLEVDYVW